MARTSRVLVVAAAVCGVSLALTGCGDSETATTSSAAGKTEQPSVPEEAEPDEVLRAAIAAAKGASSVHVEGTIPDESSKSGKTQVDFVLAPKGKADGSLVFDGMEVRLLRVGKGFYLKGNKAFYEKQGGKEFAKVIGSRWMKVSPDGAGFEVVKDLTAVGDMLERFLPSTAKYERVDGRPVGGAKTLGLRRSGTDGVLYFAATGKPYPLSIDAGKEWKLTFADWGKKASIKAPAKSKVLDTSTM